MCDWVADGNCYRCAGRTRTSGTRGWGASSPTGLFRATPPRGSTAPRSSRSTTASPCKQRAAKRSVAVAVAVAAFQLVRSPPKTTVEHWGRRRAGGRRAEGTRGTRQAVKKNLRATRALFTALASRPVCWACTPWAAVRGQRSAGGWAACALAAIYGVTGPGPGGTGPCPGCGAGHALFLFTTDGRGVQCSCSLLTTKHAAARPPWASCPTGVQLVSNWQAAGSGVYTREWSKVRVASRSTLA